MWGPAELFSSHVALFRLAVLSTKPVVWELALLLWSVTHPLVLSARMSRGAVDVDVGVKSDTQGNEEPAGNLTPVHPHRWASFPQMCWVGGWGWDHHPRLPCLPPQLSITLSLHKQNKGKCRLGLFVFIQTRTNPTNLEQMSMNVAHF